MPPRPISLLPWLFAATLMAAPGADAAAAETAPVAPTVADAHQYFGEVIAGNGVITIHESTGKDGELLGYRAFPAQRYRGAACQSRITLQNGAFINLDWSAVEKTQASDGSLTILQGEEVKFTHFRMLLLAGGIVVEPATPMPRLILGVVDDLRRNRLLKAADLLAAACHARSKFD